MMVVVMVFPPLQRGIRSLVIGGTLVLADRGGGRRLLAAHGQGDDFGGDTAQDLGLRFGEGEQEERKRNNLGL